MFGIPLEELLLLAAALAIAGAVTGVLAGLFGVGGGAIIVPILYQVFAILAVPEAVRMQLAVGTSLAIIIPTCISAYRAHKARGAVDRTVLRQWALPCFLGVAAASAIAAVAPPSLFKLVFVTIAGVNGFLLLVGRKDWRVTSELPPPFAMRAIGFGIGLLSALMGIGGGMLSNIALLLFGRTMQQAVATSAGLGVLISLPGAIGYALAGWSKNGLPPLSLGFVSLIGLVLLAPLSMLAAPLGVRLAHAISKRRLEIAFGVYLLTMATRFLINLF
jgi:uncharacterized protein